MFLIPVSSENEHPLVRAFIDLILEDRDEADPAFQQEVTQASLAIINSQTLDFDPFRVLCRNRYDRFALNLLKAGFKPEWTAYHAQDLIQLAPVDVCAIATHAPLSRDVALPYLKELIKQKNTAIIQLSKFGLFNQILKKDQAELLEHAREYNLIPDVKEALQAIKFVNPEDLHAEVTKAQSISNKASSRLKIKRRKPKR